MSMTLSDYLNKAGVKVASAPAAAPAAPAKVAAAPAAPAAPAPEKAASAPAPEKAAAPAPTKTAAQAALEAAGIVIADAKVAEVIYADRVKAAEAEKHAELVAVNAEYEARGALATHGQIKESMAIAIACGENVTRDELIKAAAVTGTAPAEILARASKLAAQIKQAQLMAAEPSSKFFMGEWASGARDGEVLAAAERNGSTTVYPAGDAPRAPVAGIIPEQLRFTQSVTLPGNEGLNHGQPVDGGKGPKG